MNNLLLNASRALRLLRVINYNPRATLGPLCLDIAVTSRCNHKCLFCGAHSALKPGNAAPQELDRAALERLLEDCVALGVREIVFAGDGEPLLYKGLPEIIARYGGKLDIRLLTNGSTLELITPEIFARLGKLTISLNSIEPDTHRLVHGYSGGSQYPRIKSHIERLLRLPGARSKIQINYVVCRENAAEFPKLLELARQWDIYFAIRPVSPGFAALKPSALALEHIEAVRRELAAAGARRNSRRMSATLEQAWRACSIGENRFTNPGTLRPCYFGFYWGNIWSNGDYSHCTYCAGSKFGNIIDKSLREIWRSPAAQSALYAAARMAQTGKPVYSSCKGCTGPQLQSAAFHRLLGKIPFQLRRLERNAARCVRGGAENA